MLEKLDKKMKKNYEIGKQFYNKEILEKEGIEELIKNGINTNSAKDYLNLFTNLIEGKLYINPIDEEYLHFYFKKINEEYNEEGIKNALLSFTQHLDYYKNITEMNSKICNEIFHKYWNIGFQDRKVHPNENGVNTFYVGGMNGIITKRMSTNEIKRNYTIFSNLLAERLETKINNLEESYIISLAKKHYGQLTVLANKKNYFKDEKGSIYLIKSRNTDSLDALEFKISNWNFDFLVLFINDLKGQPTYRVEMPIEIIKENSNENTVTLNEKNLTDRRNIDISTSVFVMENL